MGLKIKQPGLLPAGQYDGLDSITTSVKGGEVGTLVGVDVGGGDLAAYDASGAKGYVGAAPGKRPAVTTALEEGARPLGLVDEGNSPDYGTLFGSVVGGTGGQVVVGGAPIGPHTASGSGKVTMWFKPGTYAVTLDAADTTAATGLTVTNSTLAIGAALYANETGKLTPNSTDSFEEDLVLARFVEFENNGSLVTTPRSLVNPEAANKFTQAVFEWAPPIA